MSDYCPLIQKKCKEHKCKFYCQVQGTNPQTGQTISEFDCAISWLPMLMIETSNQTKQAGAAIESFRNEVVNKQDLLDGLFNNPVEQIEGQVSESDGTTPDPPSKVIKHQARKSTKS